MEGEGGDGAAAPAEEAPTEGEGAAPPAEGVQFAEYGEGEKKEESAAAEEVGPTGEAPLESLETVTEETPEEMQQQSAAKNSGPAFAALQAAADASEEAAASRLAQLTLQVESQQQQLEVESKTNAELEDMLLRIEKHFKAEQAARRKADEAVAQAERQIVAEREQREKLELELKNRQQEAERTAALKAALAAERGALEAEKNKVEAEIEEARADARRSAEALARAEEAIRQEETVARLKLESEHNAKVARLATEIDRLREELENRTNAMGNEMMRWKSQADAAARAVSTAKDEVLERKRELDSTKEKMDILVEKLYIGREKGLELRGAIDFHLERHRALSNRHTGGGFGAPALPFEDPGASGSAVPRLPAVEGPRGGPRGGPRQAGARQAGAPGGPTPRGPKSSARGSGPQGSPGPDPASARKAGAAAPSSSRKPKAGGPAAQPEAHHPAPDPGDIDPYGGGYGVPAHDINHPGGQAPPGQGYARQAGTAPQRRGTRR